MKFNIYHYPRTEGDTPVGRVEFRGDWPWITGLEHPLKGDLREWILEQRHFFQPEFTRLTPIDRTKDEHQRGLMRSLPSIWLEAEPVT